MRVFIKRHYGIFNLSNEYLKRIYQELRIVTQLHHDNIVKFVDVIPPPSFERFHDFYFVYEFVEGCSLQRVIETISEGKNKLESEHIMYLMYQMLRGLKYLHSAKIIHRDLKPKNFLVSKEWDLYLTHFGLGRSIRSEDPRKPPIAAVYVGTRWYRSPELLLMWTLATCSADMWSIGCIMASLISGKTPFPGRNYLDQLKIIMKYLGLPKPESILGCDKGKKWIDKERATCQCESEGLKKLLPTASENEFDLITKLLCFDARKRLTVDEALKHPFFDEIREEKEEEDVWKGGVCEVTRKLKDGESWKELIWEEMVKWWRKNDEKDGIEVDEKRKRKTQEEQK